MKEISLEGTLLGFEEHRHFTIEDAFGEDSQFRLLNCKDAGVSFVVVNPFLLFGDYEVEIKEPVAEALGLNNAPEEAIAVLSIVRCGEGELLANLRSPLIINTTSNRFAQIILQNEGYGLAVPMCESPEPEK